MIKKVINGELEITLLAILVIVALSTVINPLSHANEQIDTTATPEIDYIEIEVLPDAAELYNEAEFIYPKSATSKYETKPLEKEAILRTIPSITTDDNKTLGLIIPPFAYFAKKF